MAEKVKTTISDSVADTLFIPLLMRSLETKRQNGIIKDPVSCELVDMIDYDFSRFENSRLSQIGCGIRVRHFDNRTREFIRKNDTPVIISIGAGLDTRFQRVDEGKGIFYEIDLPEVISFRKQLLPESERNIYIATSMFETEWMHTIVKAHPDARFMIQAEGVFMYFEEKQMKEMITHLAEIFLQGELHFDGCTTWACKKAHKHDTVKKNNATFKWGLDDLKRPEVWSPMLRYRESWRYFDQEKKRWGFMGFIGRLLPSLKNAHRMIRYDLVPVA